MHIGKDKEFEKNIPAMLNQLDEKLKKPIEMFFHEGLTFQEISEALQLPIGTVISRIAKGKVLLARIF
jgi:RNA polymerase sigma-70 factor (ECF subfamily)